MIFLNKETIKHNVAKIQKFKQPFISEVTAWVIFVMLHNKRISEKMKVKHSFALQLP